MKESRSTFASRVFFWLGLLIAFGLIRFVWPGKGYYFLLAAQRPLHPYHAFLRSSGRGGLTFGAVGTLLMFLNLTYLVRRKLLRLEWLGDMSSWMSFHVFTGLLAPLLILLHSTGLLRSPNATIAFLALMVVVVTGVVGRYIYAHTPRSVQGRELELADLQKRLGAYRADLQKLGMPMDLFETRLPGQEEAASSGMVSMLLSFVRSDYEESAEHKRLRETVLASPSLRPQAGPILAIGDKFFRERHWLERYHELRSFMASWRFFHRWFAIVMLVLAAFHILVAVEMTDLWFLHYLKAAH